MARKSPNLNNKTTLPNGDDQSTWSSPEPSQSGYVEFEKSDIYPDRKLRLKDFLADKTHGKVKNDSDGRGKNPIPIAYNNDPQQQKIDDYQESMSEAVNMFNSLSNQYDSMGLNKEQKLPKNEVIENRIVNNSRWSGISKPSVLENNSEKVLIDNNSAFQQEIFNQFLDANGRIDYNSYFEQMKKIGVGLSEKTSRPHNSNYGITGYTKELNDLSDTFNRKEMPTISELIEEALNVDSIPEAIPRNNKTFGHLNTAAKQFDNGGSVRSSIELASLLFQIWVQVSVKILISSNILHIGEVFFGKINNDEKFGGERFDTIMIGNPVEPWKYSKGSSGYHPQMVDGIDEGFKETQISKTTNGQLQRGVLTNGLALEAITKIEKLFNLPKTLLEELNIYYPRHTLSILSNPTGTSPARKNINAATVYLQAIVAGWGKFTVNVTTDLKSNGYYRNLFHDIIRSKAYNREFINQYDSDDSSFTEEVGTWGVYEILKNYFGNNDKIMKFANYLAIIGDISMADGAVGQIAFPENKVPLDYVSQHPSLRLARSRWWDDESKTYKSPLSMTWLKNLDIQQARYEDTKALEGPQYPPPQQILGDSNRFTNEQVKEVEDRLQAEYMPFYIHDLRTNEIIAFHAFLDSIEDSYTGEWNAVKGFGRIEAAQIYAGGQRSIGCSFTMVPMNEDDFNNMWQKIDKLTTLVYPQWSKGTEMTIDGEKFVQPFSQVPTASPLCRLRVGDLFVSNYSEKAMQKMMNITSTSDLLKDSNPIIKSFRSNMGRGIVVAVNSIQFDWQLNTIPWNLEPGKKVPRMCKVSLGLIPIHDITPGITHTGENRAPIYGVGDRHDSGLFSGKQDPYASNNITSGNDPFANKWTQESYNSLNSEVNIHMKDGLKGVKQNKSNQGDV